MDKTRVSAVYVFSLLFVGFAIYAVGVLMNINTLRKIHGEYIKGFFFQKQCSDEYTEYESLRRHGYESLKNSRGALDSGAFVFLLILFWIPILLAALMMGYMINPSKQIGFLIWAWFLAVIVLFMMSVLFYVLIDVKTREKFYQFFQGTYCNTISPNNARYTMFQGAMFLFTSVLVYSYYTLHSNTEDGRTTGYIKNFTSGETPDRGKFLGYEIYQYSDANKSLVYFFVVVWILVAAWVYLSNKQYMRMRRDILCYYEGLMEDYKDALMNYIYPVPDPALYPTKAAYDRETEDRFKRIKDHVERNYLRIHGSMPSPTIQEDDSIADYAIYLMNWRGREFEDFPESPELNALRDFMYRLRTDRIYKKAFDSYFKFNKWYLLIHLIIVVYILFHLLYDKSPEFQKWMTVFIAIAILVGVFLLSWYAWFDIALRV